MSDATRRAEAQQPAPPDSAPLDDLAVADWVRHGNPDLELEFARTVGQVRQAFRDLYLSDCECGECGESFSEWPPVVFVGNDGRVFVASLDVVVRPATPDEVREAVADELENVNGYAAARTKALHGLLPTSVA